MKYPWLESMRHLWFEKGAYVSKKTRTFITKEFEPSQVKNIAVIRHAALGDQVVVRPFLIEARRFFPNAKITFVGVSNYLYGLPNDLVDAVHIMPGNDQKPKADIKTRIANIKALGKQDVIFDLAGTNRSYWMMALSQAKLKVGFPYKPFLHGLLYNLAVYRSDFSPEVECMLDMLRILGHNPPNRLEFGYPDNAEQRDKDKPFILYFNGASQLRKILTKEQMHDLVKKSIEAFPDYEHIYLEGKNDFEKGEFLEDLSAKTNFHIQPCLALDELISLIAKATVLVAPDTGVRNIAISTHTPTVGIFYSTVPFRYTPRYEPHQIVMRADATIPSSEEILQGIQASLDNIK